MLVGEARLEGRVAGGEILDGPRVAGLALRLGERGDVSDATFVLSVAHQAIGRSHIGAAFNNPIVRLLLVTAKAMTFGACGRKAVRSLSAGGRPARRLPARRLCAGRRDAGRLHCGHHGRRAPKCPPPSTGAAAERRVAGGAGGCANEMRMRRGERSGIERARVSGQHVRFERQQRDESHGRSNGDRRKPAAPYGKRSARDARRPVQAATAVWAGTVRAGPTVGGRPAAFPRIAGTPWCARILPAADAKCRRAELARRIPACGSAAAPSQLGPFIRAAVMTKAIRAAVHRAKTWTRMRCHTASASIAAASGT
jgi:hypothetical protein